MQYTRDAVHFKYVLYVLLECKPVKRNLELAIPPGTFTHLARSVAAANTAATVVDKQAEKEVGAVVAYQFFAASHIRLKGLLCVCSSKLNVMNR